MMKLHFHHTPFHLLKIMISYFDLSTPKTYYSRDKCLDILYRKEISAILPYFGLNLVAMATVLAPLKIQIAYLNSATSKTLFMRKTVSYTHLTLPTIYSV